MENNYSVEEILSAIDDLQKIKKEKKITSVKNTHKLLTVSETCTGPVSSITKA